jgi:hypothetical protein
MIMKTSHLSNFTNSISRFCWNIGESLSTSSKRRGQSLFQRYYTMQQCSLNYQETWERLCVMHWCCSLLFC